MIHQTENETRCSCTTQEMADAYLRAVKNNPNEKLFCKLLNGLEKKVDERYPEAVFYRRGNTVYFEQDLKNMYFWCDLHLVWSQFRDQFSMQYPDWQKFVEGMVWKTLKLKGYTPRKLGM